MSKYRCSRRSVAAKKQYGNPVLLVAIYVVTRQLKVGRHQTGLGGRRLDEQQMRPATRLEVSRVDSRLVLSRGRVRAELA
jgi:hypothetical protein